MNAGHTNSLSSSTLTPPLAKSWQTPVPGGAYSYPLVVGGRVFTSVITNGNSAQSLYALDLGAGAVLWGPVIGGSLAYDAGLVYALDGGGRIRAYNEVTGIMAWSALLPGGFQTTSALQPTAPVIYAGTIFASLGSIVDAVSEVDGTVLWSKPGPAGSPTVSASGVYVMGECGSGLALNRTNGATLWTLPAKCSGGTLPPGTVLGAGKLFAPVTGESTLSLDPITGARRSAFSWVDAVDAGMVIQSLPGSVRAVDAATNLIKWSIPNSSSIYPPLVANGAVYLFDGHGTLTALSEADGSLLWSGDVGSGMASGLYGNVAPSLAEGDGHLVIPIDGGLVAYSTAGGCLAQGAPNAGQSARQTPRALTTAGDVTTFQISPSHDGHQPIGGPSAPLSQIWSRDLGVYPVAYPVISAGRVFASTVDTVFAIDGATGTDLWSMDAPGNPHLAYDNATLFIDDGVSRLRSVDPASGATNWLIFRPVGGSVFMFSTPVPTADAGKIYTFLPDGGIGAYSEVDGTPVWALSFYPFHTPVSLSATAAFAAFSNETVFALDRQTGAQLWSHYPSNQASANDGYASVPHGDRLYVRGAQYYGPPFADAVVLDAATGGLVSRYNSFRPPAFDGNTEVALADFGAGPPTLHAYSLPSMASIWSFSGDGALTSSSIISGGLVFVGSANGNIYALNEASGEQVWTADAGAPLSDPANGVEPVSFGVGNGLLIVPANNLLVAYATSVPAGTGAAATTTKPRLPLRPATPRAAMSCSKPVARISSSTSQYTLANNDGVTWKEIDPVKLRVAYTASVSQYALLGANSDLFTGKAGENQDLGIFVSDNGAPDQLLAWKESGGFAGTFSPNAAYVQARYSMTSGHAYLFKLKWKTNKDAAGVTIYAGAGTGPYSPTSLLVETFQNGVVPNFAVSTTQYSLTGSNGMTWQNIDASNLATALNPAASATAILSANVDLFTATKGYNQDVGIFVSDNGGPDVIVGWKESGGAAGAYSPNAAFLRATYAMTGGHSYGFKLKWKTNKSAAGATIFAGAGTGPYSPTSLAAETVDTGSALHSAVSNRQYQLHDSNGATWQPLDPALNVAVSPVGGTNAIVGTNADLFTGNAGSNQDIGIFVSDNGGADTLVTWKESGGSGGVFSPNAAFAQATYAMAAGHTYSFKLKWKTNKPAAGVTIFAGAGASAPYSNTSLTVELSN